MTLIPCEIAKLDKEDLDMFSIEVRISSIYAYERGMWIKPDQDDQAGKGEDK